MNLVNFRYFLMLWVVCHLLKELPGRYYTTLENPYLTGHAIWNCCIFLELCFLCNLMPRGIRSLLDMTASVLVNSEYLWLPTHVLSLSC